MFVFNQYYNYCKHYHSLAKQIKEGKHVFDPALIIRNKLSRELVPPNHRHE
jgi:hypothetical protein